MYWHGIGRNRTYFLDGGAGREPLSPNLSINDLFASRKLSKFDVFVIASDVISDETVYSSNYVE
jgi:hypothetical protein